MSTITARDGAEPMAADDVAAAVCKVTLAGKGAIPMENAVAVSTAGSGGQIVVATS